MRKLVAAARRFAEPEGNRRRLAMRILDADAARLDAQDAIRGVAQLEDVAGEALDGKVLVDCADELAGRLQHDVVVGRIGNRAPGGDRREPGASASAQDMIYRVPVHVRSAMTAARAEAFGEHAHDLHE